MRALAITFGDLAETLRRAVAPAVDAATAELADEVARRLADGLGPDGGVTVHRRGAGDFEVRAEGEGLFAREFGALDLAGDPAVAPAVAELRWRREP